MAKQVIKLGLEFDTSTAISSYRKLVQEMEKSGAEPKLITELTRGLDKAEKEMNQLSAQAKLGFSDSKSIEQYSKKVTKVSTELQQLGKRIEDISGDSLNFPTSSLEQAKKSIIDLQKQLEKLNQTAAKELTENLKSIGFTDAQIANIKATVKTQEELLQKLEEERKIRSRISTEALAVRAPVAKKVWNEAGDSVGINSAQDYGIINANVQSILAPLGKGADGLLAEMISKQIVFGLKAGFDESETTSYAKRAAAEFGDRLGEEGQKALIQAIEEAMDAAMKDAEGSLGRVFVTRDATLNNTKEGKAYLAASKEYGKMADGPDLNGAATKTVEDFANAQQHLNQIQEQQAQIQETLAQKEREEAENREKIAQAAREQEENVKQATERTQEDTKAMYDSTKAEEEMAAGFERIKNNILQFLSVGSMINNVRNIIRQTFSDVQNLDKSFASIAMVTDKTVSGLWSTYGEYATMAADLGQKTDSVIKASALFYQQGLDTNEALSLTTDTMKLATLAGNDYETATQEMTAALRGIKMEMEEGNHVTDVYSELAAHAAASVDDIAKAMQRTASIANSAGMSFENTSAFLTQMIETTQESAENIGTSMKTIIARFTELKENVAGTADSEFDDLDFNKVDKALKSVGVELKDVNGQFRNLDDVFLELSQRWNTLDRNTQRYVATIAAGSRQQSRFIAMMDNYERTVELMETAADAEGKADEQFAKYADTIEYRLNQIKTKWEEIRVSFLDSDFFKGLLDSLNSFMDRLKGVDIGKALFAAPFAIKAAKSFIQSFLSTAQDTIKNSTTIIKAFSASLKKNKLKMQVGLDTASAEAELKKFNTQIENQKNKYGNITYNALLKSNIPQVVTDTTAVIEQIKNSAKELNGVVMSDTEAYAELSRVLGEDLYEGAYLSGENLKKLQGIMEGVKTSSENASAVTKLINQEQIKTSASSMALNQVMSALTLTISGLATGAMSAEEAFSTFGKSVIGIAAQVALSATQQATSMAISTAATQGQTLAFKELAAAGLSALASIAPLLIALVAIAAVSGVVAFMLKMADAENKAADAAYQLERATNELKDAQAQLNEVKNEYGSLKEEKDSLEELTNEYNKLYKKQVRTTEEQNKLNELTGEIKEKYPEIISYEDEESGLLNINNTILDQKLTKLDDEIEKKKELLALEQGRILVSSNEVDTYDSINKVDEALGGNVIHVSDGQEVARWRQLLSGELKANELDDFGYAITETFLNLFADDKITEAQYNEIRDSNMDDVFHYLTTGKINDTVTGLSAELQEALAEVSVAVKESAESIGLFDSSLKSASEQVDVLYANASQSEKNIRAAWAASNTISDIGTFEDFFSSLEYAFVGDNTDTAISNMKYMLEEFSNQYNFSDAQKNEAKQKVDVFADVYDAVAEGAWGRENDYDDVIKKLAGNEEAKEILKAIGVTGQESYEDFFGKADVSDSEAQKKILKEYYKYLTSQILEQEGIYDVDENILDAVVDFQQDLNNLTADQIKERYNNLNTLLEGTNEDFKNVVLQQLPESQSDFNALQNTIHEIFNGTADSLKYGTQQALLGAYNEIKDITGSSGVAEQFSNEILGYLKEKGISEDKWAAWLKIDWSQASDPATFKEFRENTIQQFKEVGYENAEAMFDELAEYAEKYGALNITINTEVELENFLDQIDEVKDQIESLGDSIVSAIGDITETGEISYDTFKSLKDDLKQLGLNVYDYVNIDKNGRITADQEQLKQLYLDQEETQKEQLKLEAQKMDLTISQLKTQAATLDAQISALENGDGLIRVNADINDSLLPIYNNWRNIAAIIGKITNTDLTSNIGKFDTTFYVSDSNKSSVIDALKKERDAIYSELGIQENLLDILNSEIDNFDKEGAARLRNFNDNLAEATTRTNELEKAQKDLAKAQEDLLKKQEALNKAIEDYNELMYGSEHRDSKLDSLYNYTTRLEYLNDKIERSKQILDTASTTEEATAALEDYSKAMHSYLVTLKAQQEVRKAYANESETKLLNHSETIYDPINGTNISFNYADFVKKNADGTYAIDQFLLEQAKFANAFKDELEQAVSDYNDNYKEWRATDAEIVKLEKEIEDRRKNAIKNYAKFEKEIADTLKEEYQREVDDLKNKYDSMKEADDDYVNALQEAIEKQRKLREKENKWEDLAKKEKKLSLMSRDTSGANRADTLKLQEEIQKDRQDLLDEAIDDVIEGLSDLYQSQQELRDTEIELKEALLENTLYWNEQAEGLAASFNSAEEYMEWIFNHNAELSEMTLTQAQDKLNEYGDSFIAASQKIAMDAIDAASDSGNMIIDITQATGDEIQQVVIDTSEVFVHEVEHSMTQVRKEFTDDMDAAIQKINDAKQALQDAIDKVNEYATEVQKAWNILNSKLNDKNDDEDKEAESTKIIGQRLAELAQQRIVNSGNSGAISAIDKEASSVLGSTAYWTGSGYTADKYSSEYFINGMRQLFPEDIYTQILTKQFPVNIGSTDNKEAQELINKIPILKSYGLGVARIGTGIFVYSDDTSALKGIQKNAASVYGNVEKFKTGGLVEYTGPAWVDGSPERPEAFLSAEDTERIGRAANILANIPLLNPTGNVSNTNNTYGDTAVEININIENISSPDDVDYMLERLKSDIVSVARPVGTNVILQQSL